MYLCSKPLSKLQAIICIYRFCVVAVLSLLIYLKFLLWSWHCHNTLSVITWFSILGFLSDFFWKSYVLIYMGLSIVYSGFVTWQCFLYTYSKLLPWSWTAMAYCLNSFWWNYSASTSTYLWCYSRNMGLEIFRYFCSKFHSKFQEIIFILRLCGTAALSLIIFSKLLLWKVALLWHTAMKSLIWIYW